MLKTICEDFRARFEPRAESAAEHEAHRRSCAECARWASRLEAFTGGESPAPLPGGLRERLLAIPRGEGARRAACGDVERLYEATWREAWRGEVDPAVNEHLAECGRCRGLYGALEAAFREPRPRMPRSLLRRLRSLAERPRVPLFARDGRLAIAASAVLTASLLLATGDPSQVFKTAVETVSSRASAIAEAGESRGQALWESVADKVETRFLKGREALAEQGHAYRDLLNEARFNYENGNWRQLLESVTFEGESDGEP